MCTCIHTNTRETKIDEEKTKIDEEKTERDRQRQTETLRREGHREIYRQTYRHGDSREKRKYDRCFSKGKVTVSYFRYSQQNLTQLFLVYTFLKSKVFLSTPSRKNRIVGYKILIYLNFNRYHRK